MKRRDTSSPEMQQDFKELKARGIHEFFCETIIGYYGDPGYKRLMPVLKHTAQGVSAYANRMYNKYGDNVTVRVSYFDSDWSLKLYTTYHA